MNTPVWRSQECAHTSAMVLHRGTPWAVPILPLEQDPREPSHCAEGAAAGKSRGSHGSC